MGVHGVYVPNSSCMAPLCQFAFLHQQYTFCIVWRPMVHKVPVGALMERVAFETLTSSTKISDGNTYERIMLIGTDTYLILAVHIGQWWTNPWGISPIYLLMLARETKSPADLLFHPTEYRMKQRSYYYVLTKNEKYREGDFISQTE